MYSLLVLLAVPLAVSAQVPGGINNVAVKNQQIPDKVWTGMAAVNAASNSPNYLVPVKVVSATSQVVSGMKYTWTVEMAETNCNKEANFDRNSCVASANAPTSLYKITLWEQSWLDHAEYTAEKIN